MVKKKLFSSFTLVLITLFFSSANYGINAKAAGIVPPLSPPYEPGYTPLYQNGTTPQCRVDACIGACTMERLVWGRQATFNTYMDVITPLAGCNQGELGAALDAALDEASELASVDTGAFLNCGEIWAGVEYGCAQDCEASLNHCRFAPDLRVSIPPDADPVADQGVLISLNNDGLDATAITGGIDLIASIEFNTWAEPIPFAWYQLPSLGYHGLDWTTAAAAECMDDTDRCQYLNILAAAQLNQEIPISLPNGGVYNLENLVSSSAGVDNLSSGFAELIQGGDRVTMNSGLSGITFVREDFNWNGVWDNQYVETWNSWSGEYTVSNAECHYMCWFGTQTVNRDKFVLVLDGPCESLLLGDYTLSVEAPLDHDQNIVNNSDEVDYSVGSIPSGCGGGWDSISASVEATLTQGPHELTFTRELVKYYRVVVPEDASLLEVVLEGPNSSNSNDNLDLLLRRGSIPETTRQGFVAYDYIAQDDVGYKDKLRIPVPEPGEWFIEVYHSGLLYSNDFQLAVNVETSDTPIVDLTEGHYALNFESGHTSQVFRLRYPNHLEGMNVSFEPPRTLGFLPNNSFKIYMCPERTPAINYEHAVFPGTFCYAGSQIAFTGQGWLNWPLEADITYTGGQNYYILVERTSGDLNQNYNFNIDFTWPAGVGIETEPNNDCASANAWPTDDIDIPRRGYFDPAGDQDVYTVQLYQGGDSVEMETYLASVPADIAPALIVLKKVGTAYQEVAADRSAARGGSPSVRFDLIYGETYCIQVKPMNPAHSQTDPYSLYIRDARLASTDETEVEPNNFYEEATRWESTDDAMRGYWSAGSDHDWFKWTTDNPGVYFIAVNKTPTVPIHTLIVYEGFPQVVNQGTNLFKLDPVGLTFYAKANTDYYFELLPAEPASSAGTEMYKLALQHLDDYGATCSGAAMLNLSQYNPTSNMMDNLISSQLPTGDQDCFHVQPPMAGSYMLALTPPDNVPAAGGNPPLIDLFSYNPNAFDFGNETRTPLGQFTNTSGIGANGEYTLWFISPPGPPTGLTYTFPGFDPNVGYCACISAGTPSGGNGHPGGSRDDWQTYTDQTYGFTFRYPAEGQIVNQQDHSARISLPFMPGTNLAEKFVDVAVMENADPCVSQNPGVSQSQLLTVNGIPFLEESGADAGAGHFYEWIAYSTSKNKVCASLTFVLNSTNPGNYTISPPLFDKPAESDVFAPILATFAWLNPYTNVTSCNSGTLMVRDNISHGMIDTPGNQDYFKRDSLYENTQYQVSLEAVECDMPLHVDVIDIETGEVLYFGETNTTSCKVYVDFTPNSSSSCLRVSAMDSTASSDVDYNLSIYLNAK